jgi:AraC-like DNA-binding protein/quercetin dioxygenase-like cupin family protein
MIANYENTNDCREENFVVKQAQGECFPFYWHYNSCYELTLITAGSGTRYIGDDISGFAPGELVLLGPNLPHTWNSHESEKRCEAVVVHFNDDFAGAGLFEKPEMKSLKDMLESSSRGLLFDSGCSEKLAHHIAALCDTDGWKRTTSLLNILGSLSDSRRATISQGESFASLDKSSQERFSRVCAHINANFTSPDLCQSGIAAAVHMSRSRFSQFFRQVSGRSYIEHLNSLRINHACKLLIETDKPVTDICFDSGFNNIANFNRHFLKQKNKTPRQYRSAFTKQ